MEQWQQMVMKMPDKLVDVTLTLEQLGREGWELVAVFEHKEHGVLLFFKRPRS